ncbi:uncharacterized protein LOC133880461 isoform X2 [Alnus glutinosa]|uniref:uncharacterized protein LOC133880461 isoform X2 n=1 Tax=Alnus glutinosa TaxID=3517 RepID=UPI002D7A1CFF|nr:uncharacterized protein LOC133880461 isoform X2 [Alnus glutinosa]
MAGARIAALSSLTPSINPTATTPTKPLVLACLPKPTKRKNYLRPKILKTLPKLPPNPIIPILSPETETPLEPHLDSESPADETFGDNCAADKVEEFRVSETSAEHDGVVGKFSSKSVLKYGAYLVGIFVFQTFCAVWVLGNANSERKERNLDNSDLGIGENNKGKFLLSENGIGYVQDDELERKIEEIRAMAREARRSEAKAVKEDVEGDDDVGEESAVSRHRDGIEKEIGARLIKLQKKLNSTPEGLPGLFVNYLGMSGKGEDRVSRDSSDSNEANGMLMFKKKSKFRSPSTKRVDRPKGFGGTRDRNTKKSGSGRVGTMSRNGSVGDDGVELLDLEMQVGQQHSDYQERGRADLEKEMGFGNAEQRNGVFQETGLERPSVELVNSQQSVKLGTHHSQRFANGKPETTTTSDKHAVLSINRSSKQREVGDETLANKFREKQPKNETDFWWSSLPYVLVIVIRRGSEHEGQGGLYTLKTASQAQEQSSSSYTVAFEDQVDAKNFCFLLESFFEELGNFSADIVPLSIKELHEAAEANAMKVIVVKKRQLQLYAGQPFADVEMALHSLVEED